MKARSIAAWGIIGIWLVVIGVHVKREYFLAESARLEVGARMLAPGSHYFVVRMNGRAIGTATTQLDTVADGFDFSDDLLLDVPAMDTVHRATTATRMKLDRSLQMRQFSFRLDSKIGSFTVDGTATNDSMMDVSVQAGGELQRSRVPLAGGVVLDGGVTIRLAAAGRLEPGTELHVRTFDPSALDTRDVLVRVIGTDTLIVPDSARYGENGRWEATVLDTVPVWLVEQRFGGVALSNWVDEDGLAVRAESPLGLEIERTTFELARQEWASARADPTAAAGYGAVIEGTAIASDVDLTGLESAASLSVRLTGVDLEGFDLAGGRQSLSGDTLVIRREDESEIVDAGYRLPWSRAGAPAAALVSTPLIQSDDDRIREQASAATNRTRDPAAAARRLNQWVYRNVRKEITPSIPSAVQVLEALQGDCNEHTVLYVALARSIGLPARTAVGLVHIRGRFYFHAWPEVWLADEWVAIDPTLGQYPADASHLRFLVGGLARNVELIRLIGRLKIDVQ